MIVQATQQYTVKPPPLPTKTETNGPVAPTAPIKRVENVPGAPEVTAKRVVTIRDNSTAPAKRSTDVPVTPTASIKRVESTKGTIESKAQRVAADQNNPTSPTMQTETEQDNTVRMQTGQANTTTHKLLTPPMNRGIRVHERQEDGQTIEPSVHQEQFKAAAKAKQVKWHGEPATEVTDKTQQDMLLQHPQEATVSNTAAIKSATNPAHDKPAKMNGAAEDPTPVMVYYAQLAHLILPVHFDSCASHNFIGTRELWSKLLEAGIRESNCSAFGVAQGSSLPPVTQYMILAFTCVDDGGVLQHDKQAIFYYCPVGATVLISKRQANQANILRYQPPAQYLETLLQHQTRNQGAIAFYTTVVVDFAVQVDTVNGNDTAETNTTIQVEVQTSVQEMNAEEQRALKNDTIEIITHGVSSDGTCLFEATAEAMKHFVELHQKALQGRRDHGELAEILQRATPQQLRSAACDLIYKYQNEKLPNLGGRTPREYIRQKYIDGNKPLKIVNRHYTNTASSLEAPTESLQHITSVHDYLIAMRRASTKGDTLGVVMLVEYVGIRIIIFKQRMGGKHLSIQADMRPTDLQKMIQRSGNEALHLAGSGTYTTTKHIILFRDVTSFQWAHLSAESRCKHVDCAPLLRAIRVSRTVLADEFRYGIPEIGKDDETEDTFRKEMMGRCLLSLGQPENIEEEVKPAVTSTTQMEMTQPTASDSSLGSNPDHASEEPTWTTQQSKPP